MCVVDSVIMTTSSTVLALLLMPLCLWLYSRAWINTPVVQLLPLGAVTLTVCSTLIPIGLGVALRSRYPRAADIMLKVTSDTSNRLRVTSQTACCCRLTSMAINTEFRHSQDLNVAFVV